MAKRMRQHFENGGGAGSGGLRELLGGSRGGGGRHGSGLPPRLVQASLPIAARLFRAYVGIKAHFDGVASGVGRILNPAGAGSAAPGSSSSTALFGHSIDHRPAKPPPPRRHNLNRILKTLVHVHGLQMLRDGVYNADPHPVSFISPYLYEGLQIQPAVLTHVSSFSDFRRVTS